LKILPSLGLTNVIITLTLDDNLNPIVHNANYNPSTGVWSIFGIPAGNYFVRIVGDGITSETFTLTISADIDISMALGKFIVTETDLPDNMWRFVLTWDDQRDLDTLVYYPSGELVTYNNKIGSDGKVILDLDNRDGTGPETATILNDLTVGAYHYIVYNYNNNSDLHVSNALVRIYNLGVLHTSVSVPNAEGIYWYVCDLSFAGLTLINTMSVTDPFAIVSNNTYSFKTTLISAMTGQLMQTLVGVQVVFTMNGNNAQFFGSYDSQSGTILVTGLPAGLYHVSVSASSVISFTWDIEINHNIDNDPAYRFALCQSLNPNQYRAILTWGQNPMDLDTQAVLVDRNQSQEIVTYYNKLSTSTYFSNMVFLDLDDTDGWGPETLTITNNMTDPQDFVYYIVMDFEMTGNIKVSNAKVCLYQGSGLAQTWTVGTATEANSSSNFWHVFRLNMNGFTSINVLNNSATPIAP